ncbi:MAG: hypothetical protein JOZ12_05175 [Sinobacteraceae bacterium]|nr:hypothetical protein [Nevskiaceae bacterium]
MAATAVAAVAAGSALAAAAEGTRQGSEDEAQSAVWTAKELTFVYQGFTSKYSCDGLRDKMYTLLLQLGARKQDLKVNEYGCINFSRPDPFPGVKVRMSVLQPVSGASNTAGSKSNDKSADRSGDQSGEPVPAHWKSVELQPDRVDFTTGSGSCELMEQVHSKVLPLFATRNVDFRSTCIPHQATPGGTSLRLEVLQPDVQKPAGTPPAGQ